MADHFPRNSSNTEEYGVIEGRNILETLRDGNLNLVTASRKRRKISVKYHNEDIEQCYHKVRRSSNNPTVTDLENSLDETQGTPRKKKFGDGNLNLVTASRKRRKISVKYHNEDIEQCYHKVRRSSNNPTVTDLENSLDETQDELEDEIIRLEDTKKNLHQFIESEKQHGNEVLRRVIQSKNEDMIRVITSQNEDMMRCLQEKDEESAKKDEINRRLQEENHRKDEINRRLQVENQRKDEIIRKLEENNRNKEEKNRMEEIIRRLEEENKRNKEIIRRLEDKC